MPKKGGNKRGRPPAGERKIGERELSQIARLWLHGNPLVDIAARFGVTVEELQKANNITDPGQVARAMGNGRKPGSRRPAVWDAASSIRGPAGRPTNPLPSSPLPPPMRAVSKI